MRRKRTSGHVSPSWSMLLMIKCFNKVLEVFVEKRKRCSLTATTQVLRRSLNHLRGVSSMFPSSHGQRQFPQLARTLWACCLNSRTAGSTRESRLTSFVLESTCSNPALGPLRRTQEQERLPHLPGSGFGKPRSADRSRINKN